VSITKQIQQTLIDFAHIFQLDLSSNPFSQAVSLLIGSCAKEEHPHDLYRKLFH
jgi:hypothetical protein